MATLHYDQYTILIFKNRASYI